MDYLESDTRSTSITQGASTVDSLPAADDPDRIQEHLNRFLTTEDIIHLNHAIAPMEQIISAPTTSNHRRVWMLASLSEIRLDKFNQFHVLDDLEKGIEAGKKAIEGTEVDDPSRMERWSHLSTMFHARYLSLDATDDLGKAINASHQALAADSPNHPFHSAQLSNLANQYLDFLQNKYLWL